MSSRLDKTAADYIAIAVGPALIMAMVGSLVYFLLEVLYQGEYEVRLQWIMSCFVFAAVLIGRIAITEGTARAAMFALALALVMGVAIAMLVEHRGPLAAIGLYLDWALLGVIWWCAHKLTWDCTFIDERQPDTGEGLLQTIGMDDDAQATNPPAEAAERTAAQLRAPLRNPLGTTGHGTRSVPTTLTGDDDDTARKPAWERWFSGDARPHAPGKWVVYFSLAALPIFGVGQLFIPAASEERRQYVFRLLAIYVASGLGLLLTTSFLGMRRYLRQRQVEMPSRVAGKWIALGAGLALGLIVLAVLLPRPNAEFAVSSLTGTIGSPQRQASRAAPTGGEGSSDPAKQSRSTTTKGKDPGQQGAAATKTGAGGDSGESKTPGGSPTAKSPSGGENSKSSGSEGTKSRSGAENGKTSAATDTKSTGGKSPDPASSETKTSDPAKSGDPSSTTGGQAKQNGQSSGTGPSDQGDKKQDGGQEQNKSPGAPSSPGGSSSPGSSNFRPLESLSSAVSWLPTLLKWVFHGIVIAVVAFFSWRHRRELLAALAGLWADLRNLLVGLFGGRKTARAAAPTATQTPPGPKGRPFADYPNPFTSGLAGRITADQLVAYTFEALEAWARDHGCPRGPEQTPLEFAAALGAASAPLADPVRLLALLYSQMAYAPGTLRSHRTEELEYLWRLLSGGGGTL